MRLSFLIAGLLFSQGLMAAPAQTSLSRLDLFYARSSLSEDGTSGTVKGSGFGLRGWIGRSCPIVTMEYTDSDIDGDIDDVAQVGEIKTRRGGLGIRILETPTASAWARAEYLSLDIRLNDASALDDDGYAIHLGGRAGIRDFDGYAEIGAVKTSDAKGTEGRIGVGYQPANWGLFVEYRLANLKLDPDDTDIKLGDGRAGIRWAF